MPEQVSNALQRHNDLMAEYVVLTKAAAEKEVGRAYAEIDANRLRQSSVFYTSLEGRAVRAILQSDKERTEAAERLKQVASARVERWIAAGRPVGDVIDTTDGNWALRPDGLE